MVNFADTKLKDTPNMLYNEGPQMGRGLLGWYRREYVNKRPGNVIFHLIGTVCFVGYCLNYGHISKYLYAGFHLNFFTIQFRG